MGVDEAGRGPLLGPVFAAAVILKPGVCTKESGIKDSKLYHSRKGLEIAQRKVLAAARVIGVGSASVAEIDSMNIRRATHLAMHRAIASGLEQLGSEREKVKLYIDGNDFTPYSRPGIDTIDGVPYECVVKGDSKVDAISAASIIAKVSRDQEVIRLCEELPELRDIYGADRHKGYGTRQHLDAIAKHGVTAHHRLSFRPCSQQRPFSKREGVR